MERLYGPEKELDPSKVVLDASSKIMEARKAALNEEEIMTYIMPLPYTSTENATDDLVSNFLAKIVMPMI